MFFYVFLGPNKYMEGNSILHHYFLIYKQNEEYYFIAEEHYEEYHSLVDKCLMLWLINVILLVALGHNIFDR